MQRVKPQPGPVRFGLVVRGGKGWRINADIDNRMKPTLDALVRAGIITDDSTRVVTQKEVIYETRPSRRSTVRIFVRLSEPKPTWFDTFDIPDPIINEREGRP